MAQETFRLVGPKNCSRCGLLSQESALVCDCGYRFDGVLPAASTSARDSAQQNAPDTWTRALLRFVILPGVAAGLSVLGPLLRGADAGDVADAAGDAFGLFVFCTWLGNWCWRRGYKVLAVILVALFALGWISQRMRGN